MVHARGSRGCTWTSPRLPISILCGSWRLCTEHQRDCCFQYDRSHWDLRATLHPCNICASDISTITIPEFVLGPCLVSVAEVARTQIQGSRFRWDVEVGQRKHVARTAAACHGRDRREDEAR